MASFYQTHSYGNSMSGHQSHNHHGRSRRGPRVSSQHNARQHFAKTQRAAKQQVDSVVPTAYIKDLEAAKSFDFEDDEVFCPFHLLTEDDLQSIHSSSASDRSSLSSASPETSPMQPQVQPNPSFVLSAPAHYNHAAFQQNVRVSQQQQQHQSMKLHQPLAQRSRNAIPIVDPTTRSVASPPPSVSPARQMQHQYARRW